jgi:hypothetical protein
MMEYPRIEMGSTTGSYLGKVDINQNQPSNIVIHKFMGGTLTIPLLEGEEPAKKAIEFIEKLYYISGVKEIFDEYGAEFKAPTEDKE